MPTPPRYLTHAGETLTIAEWSEWTGIPANTIRHRIVSSEWPVEKALLTPANAKFRPGKKAPREGPRACPPLKRHASGQACARWTLQGKEEVVYFGVWGSKEAGQNYARFAAEWAASGGHKTTHAIGVVELAQRWLDWAATEYVKNGKQTSEVHCCRAAIKPVVKLYGNTPASEFTPLRLKACRSEMIQLGWTRGTINLHCFRVVRCFRWGVSESLVDPAIWQALQAVSWLRAGRGHAPEKKPKEDVPDADVEAAIAHLVSGRHATAAEIEDMVRLQRLTGMRPGEVCSMKPKEIDRTADVWVYQPPAHKGIHIGQTKRVHLGPRVQAILSPRLSVLQAGSRVFRLTRNGYHDAIAAACKRAGCKHWTPHQLRHALATEVARRYSSIETAAAAIGDTPATAARHYVHLDPNERAKIDVAREMG